jgi:carboxypeptidase Q
MFWMLFACIHGPLHTDLDIDLPDEVASGVLAHPRSVADPALSSILQRAQEDHQAWLTLAELCDDIGARPAGSKALAQAVSWAVAKLADAGVDEVHTEEVTVPVWIRGEESLEMLAPRPRALALLGLGGSVGTEGIEAEVEVVRSFEELGPEVKGKIVLFDTPMLDGVPTIERYGAAVQSRVHGPSRAAELGAVAALVRSVTTRSLYTPHTGGTRFAPEVTPIPAAAITTEDAAHISRLIHRGIVVKLKLVMGAHLDSWDVGQGAHDDGAGVVEVIEAMRLIKALGPRPKRTIRAVLYTNEEHGISGGIAYAASHPKSDTEKHLVAIESDLGGGRPQAWTAKGSKKDMAWLAQSALPLGLPVLEGGGGADIWPLAEQGTLIVALRPDDTHYFDVHHTHADTVDKVDPNALAESTAALAALAWALANEE